jgi:hypothetical protein
MKLNQLREFVKQVVREEQDYQQLFKHMLDKSGKSITDMSDDEKKKFFNAVDTAYKAKSEGRLTGYNENINESSSEILKPGTKVKLRGGKTGKVVRYDGKTPGAPFYIVDIGQYYSIEVPADQIKTESVKEAELTAGQKKIDVDGDGEIEGSDLAKLRDKSESINEEEIKWNAVENAIINFLKMNTKILDKRVKDRDTDGVKGGLQSIIDGLSNAQRSLKLK